MALWGWDIEEAKVAWREEAHEAGYEAGREKGMAAGLEAGMEAGFEKGREAGREAGMAAGMEAGLEKGREEIVRNALAEGASVEFVQKITGLDIEIIENFKKSGS